MKKQTRRKFSSEFKAKVALEATKEQMTLVELSKKFDINPVVISRWKAEFLANISSVFNDKQESKEDDENVDIEKLYAQIGQLKVENDFLKKIARNWGYER
jgi:transposase-like protein